MSDPLFGDKYPVEIVKISDTEISIAGMFFDEADNPLKVKVDPTDHSISIDKQLLKVDPSSWFGQPYTNLSLSGSGLINACETSFSFSASISKDQGGFAPMEFTVVK